MHPSSSLFLFRLDNLLEIMKATAMPSALASFAKAPRGIGEDEDEDEDDCGDATTAASTADESFESCRYDDDDDETNADDDDDEDGCEDTVNLPHRFRALAVDSNFKYLSNVAEIQREILAEFSDRGRTLTERERESDRAIVDYFAATPSVSSSANLGDTRPNTRRGHRGSPLIDRDCRSKMLEWAFKLLDLSFPPSEGGIRNIRNPRQHSMEATSIAYQAFSYVDRVSSNVHLGASRAAKNMKERSNYKLLCMVSLHLACKSSGFFRFSANEGRYAERDDARLVQVNGAPCSANGSVFENEADDSSDCYHLNDPTNDWSFMTYDSSYYYSSSLSSLSSSSSSQHHGNAQHNSSSNPSSSSSSTTKPRPYMNLLSLQGLVTLAQGEFTIADLLQMELDILFDLDWKMLTATPADWTNLMTDVIAATNGHVVHAEQVCDRCFGQLERFAKRKSDEIEMVPPSLLALAAVVNALEVFGPTEGSSEAEEWSRFIQNVLGLNYNAEELKRVCVVLKNGR
ncbi:hypothetical protein ACHAXS_008194 [Conticribra weissflogii]